MGAQVDIAAGGWHSMAITEEGVVGGGIGMGRLGVSCVWQHVMEQLTGGDRCGGGGEGSTADSDSAAIRAASGGRSEWSCWGTHR